MQRQRSLAAAIAAGLALVSLASGGCGLLAAQRHPAVPEPVVSPWQTAQFAYAPQPPARYADQAAAQWAAGCSSYG